MKRILFIICLFISGSVYAQKLPDIGLNRVRIIEADKTILAEINPISSVPSPKTNLFYYWYNANTIHSTQGGFSGTLLNGQYTEYYLNKNLKEQGIFKNGLKNGVWKSWNEDGMLSQTIKWKNGLVVSKTPSRFWKKLKIFKRKTKTTKADSLVKPAK
jgi:antitoxin component YwqK of YwqJK toxin-antitoxin module